MIKILFAFFDIFMNFFRGVIYLRFSSLRLCKKIFIFYCIILDLKFLNQKISTHNNYLINGLAGI
jgi:hypothetical protein